MTALAVPGRCTEVDYVSLTIPGKPQPKQRPRRGLRGHFYTPKETQAAEQEIGYRLKEAWWKREMKKGESRLDCTGRFSITCRFYIRNPRAGDASNLLKTVEDAANGIVWKDDDQVDRVEVHRYFVAKEHQRTEIRIARIA